jgi:hypothetical protein
MSGVSRPGGLDRSAVVNTSLAAFKEHFMLLQAAGGSQ